MSKWSLNVTCWLPRKVWLTLSRALPDSTHTRSILSVSQVTFTHIAIETQPYSNPTWRLLSACVLISDYVMWKPSMSTVAAVHDERLGKCYQKANGTSGITTINIVYIQWGFCFKMNYFMHVMPMQCIYDTAGNTSFHKCWEVQSRDSEYNYTKWFSYWLHIWSF